MFYIPTVIPKFSQRTSIEVPGFNPSIKPFLRKKSKSLDFAISILIRKYG